MIIFLSDYGDGSARWEGAVVVRRRRTPSEKTGALLKFMPRTYAASTLNSSPYRIKSQSAARCDAEIFSKRIYELR